MLGMALILSYMAETKQSLPNLIANIPKYYMIKRVAQIEGDFEAKLELFKQEFNSTEVNTIDGVKFDFQKSWLHIRKSNTEPVVRIIAEAQSRSEAETLIQKASQILMEGQVKTACAE
jgi:phosphomannomutase